jgi:hypothetical protein
MNEMGEPLRVMSLALKAVIQNGVVIVDEILLHSKNNRWDLRV